jgi:catechol 2,3-dioxygenase-like lactoylglutathione lyase family enzyme
MARDGEATRRDLRESWQVLGHLGINVPDLPAAKEYYGEIMPFLGFEPFFATENEIAFMPAGGKRGTYLFIYAAQEQGDYSRHRPGLQHLAFMVPTRSAVRTVHARVAELGGEVVHDPQEFPQYPPPYFATFWLDPFGIMLEAVCHHDHD